VDDHDIGDIGRLTFDPAEQPSKIMPRDWYRMLRMMAIDRHDIMQLFRQVFGMKEISFDDVLKDTASNFGVPYEKLRDVSFEGYT